MGDLSGFVCCVGFFPPSISSISDPRQGDRKGGEQFIQNNVLPFSAASLTHRGHPPLPFMASAALPMAGPSQCLEIAQETVQKPLQVQCCLEAASKTTHPSLCHCLANLEASAWWGLKSSRRKGAHQEEGVRCDEHGGGLRSTDGLRPAGSRYLLGDSCESQATAGGKPPLPSQKSW